MKDCNIVKEIITRNSFMTLATSDSEGNVWAAPMTFAFDEDFNIYFHSALDSNHIQNIVENPEVSYAIYDSVQMLAEMDGVQAKGIVGQIADDEIEKVHSLFFKRHMPVEEIRQKFAPPAALYNSAQFPQIRFFKLITTEIHKKNIELLGVARRTTIDLEELKKVFKEA
ncbi:pyridoxamine 5'-phosphate oxidase family protein [Anaeromicropila populeti]|uniref:Uncharacterized conserved protein YhbP, UPF0306 family n=1 Tax=Anaeromicropila populeti TaxID=37658 RepID=A0A1I6HSP2_9FIRM|nr:pyridoxamine 5'-phosphate oxidase family protein [Anaeromicropila populeti]SFR57408.1 Uncharacterized conserved protein YhbP, UPF0306 family [Anaeromicropila populeti]